MTDVIEQIEDQTVSDGSDPVAEETPKTVKAVKQAHPCLCRSYELYNPKDEDEVFSTGCEGETKATFTQGHDARLVSFLVTGHFDGYSIRQLTETETGAVETVTHANPADAVRDVSAALQGKAEKATETKRKTIQDRQDRQAAREALKAKRAEEKAKAKEARAAAKAVAGPGSEVPAGDRTELTDGQVRIKVGDFEYVAVLDEDDNAVYTDGSGAERIAVQGAYEVTEIYSV